MSELPESPEEQNGLVIDRLENLTTMLMNTKVSNVTHVEILRRRLPDFVQELKVLHVQLTGENPWG